MQNEKRISNLNFNINFENWKNHFVLCLMSQLQYRSKKQIFVSDFDFNLSKKKRNRTLGTWIAYIFTH